MNTIADTVRRLGGNLTLVKKYAFIGEDGWEERTAKQTIEQILCVIKRDRWTKNTDLDTIQSINDLRMVYADALGEARLVFLVTEEEYEKLKAEQRRVELEDIARAFGKANNVGVGTFEFIRAVSDRISQYRHRQEVWNSGEVRAEQWGGSSSDPYFDDLNFENARLNNRINDLEDILGWLTQECPLLMAKYEEMKLAGTWSDT